MQWIEQDLVLLEEEERELGIGEKYVWLAELKMLKVRILIGIESKNIRKRNESRMS